MIAKITILTSFLFACVYPLCFWLSVRDPLKNNFHRFHLGLPNVIGGIVAVSLFLMDIPLSLKIYVLVWFLSLTTLTNYFWKKEYPVPLIVTVPSIIGILAYLQFQKYSIGLDLTSAASWIMGAFIFALALFAMNLGHWYLNVHGLPIEHLVRSVSALRIILFIRLFWDIFFLWMGKMVYQQDMIPIHTFLFKLDGFLLFIALFFGTVFPLIGLWFAQGTLKLKNTQATTGILYVILCSVLLGDITYKYYAIKYGVML